MAGIDEKGVPRCCFCGQPESKVARMLYGNGAYICDECVELCYQMLVNDGTLEAIPHRPSRSHQSEEETPILKPAEIKKILDDYIIGQDQAKMTLSVAVYNHYKRIFCGQDDDDIRLQKSNVLYCIIERWYNSQHLDLMLRIPSLLEKQQSIIRTVNTAENTLELCHLVRPRR